MNPDAVTVYGLFGISLTSIFAYVRVVTTTLDQIFTILNFYSVFQVVRVATACIIIFLVLRIPFKRKYHWAFLAFNVAYLWLPFWNGVPTIATNSAQQILFYLDIGVLSPFEFQAVLMFLFVSLFVSPKLSPWQKSVLIAGLAFVVVTFWGPTALGDEAFVITTPHLINTGWVPGQGTGVIYTNPYGIDYFDLIMAVLIFYLLVRYYRSTKLPLVRSQIRYLCVGILFFFAGVNLHSILEFFPALRSVPFLNVSLFFIPGDFVLLLGLRKKGFYSVTPTAETAVASEPVRYPLDEARSYLAYQPRAAYEAFSELVRGGRQGLLITRTAPDAVRKDYGIQTTPIRWLAETKGQETIPPSDLLGLSLTVKDFMGRAARPIVMLHGVEYLTTINGFTPVLRLIQGLSEENVATRGILILPVVPEGLDRHEEALLTTETTPMPVPVLHSEKSPIHRGSDLRS